MKKQTRKQLTTFFILSVLLTLLITTPVFAKDNDDTRPGWGKGDTNHIHVGPPGQSVRPDHKAIHLAVQDFNKSIHNAIKNHTLTPSFLETSFQNLFAKLKSIFHFA